MNTDRSVGIRAQQPIWVERCVVVENNTLDARASRSELIFRSESSALLRVIRGGS